VHVRQQPPRIVGHASLSTTTTRRRSPTPGCPRSNPRRPRRVPRGGSIAHRRPGAGRLSAPPHVPFGCRTLTQEDPVAVAPRPAATVVLLRDGRDGPEAYLQRRPAGMGFASGLWVFPGGRVDEADRDPAVDASWDGPPPAAWAERLGLPVDQARGQVVAACRETLEEAGLLLALPAPRGGEA